jgi:hypothetical protein
LEWALPVSCSQQSAKERHSFLRAFSLFALDCSALHIKTSSLKKISCTIREQLKSIGSLTDIKPIDFVVDRSERRNYEALFMGKFGKALLC